MYAEINGIHLFFDITGLQYVPNGAEMKERPVCFILHGGPGSSHVHFLPDILPLAEKMQLVFIDDRNCGHSEEGNINDCTMQQNVDDIEALRQYLGLDKIYVLGQSYGGMKAQLYAIQHAENLHGLILCCTAPSSRFNQTADKIIMEKATDEQKELWQMKKENRITDMNDYMYRMNSMYHHKWNKEIADEAFNANKRNPMKIAVNQHQRLGELADFDLVPELHKITCPTLIFAGKYDFITSPEHNEEIHRAIHGSEYHLLENSSHSLFSDEPETVFPIIQNFIDRTFR